MKVQTDQVGSRETRIILDLEHVDNLKSRLIFLTNVLCRITSQVDLIIYRAKLFLHT